MSSIGNIAKTIDVVLSLPTNSASVVDGIKNTISDKDFISMVSDGAQVIATVTAVAATVGVVGTAAVVGTTALAVTVTVAKNINGIDGPLNLGDILTVAGNIASVAGTTPGLLSSPIFMLLTTIKT